MPVREIAIDSDADVESLYEIRRMLCGLSEAFACRVDTEVVLLLVTELGANAIRTDTTQVRVRVRRLVGPSLHVEVSDDGGGWPQLANPAPLDEQGGRGLRIVDALSDAWGASTSEDGETTVWFELAAN
jgi:two-component sensor histidine kinase